MKKTRFYIRSIDLLGLFVFGFSFLIAVFNSELAMGYIYFLLGGSLGLMIINYLTDKNE